MWVYEWEGICGLYIKILVTYKFLGYGYCQSIEDLRHNKEISSEVMTTELLLDNSNTIPHDNQVSAFKVRGHYEWDET